LVNMRTWIVPVTVCVLVAICAYFLFWQNAVAPCSEEDDDIQAVERRETDAAASSEDSRSNDEEPQLPPQGGADKPGNTHVPAKDREETIREIEEEFQKILDADPAESTSHLSARVAKLAEKAPEVIVQKFVTGDRETSRAAVAVMYAFGWANADTSGLTPLLVDLYRNSDWYRQQAILIIFRHAKARPALPFLREVLNDTCLPPPPPPNRQESSKQRPCDDAYDAIVAILDDIGIKHGFERGGRPASYEQLDAMKAWLDSHPEILNPVPKEKQEEEKDK
jgi:hypothetical protein